MMLEVKPHTYPSYAAARFWGHVKEIARRVAVDGDAGEHGVDWGRRALSRVGKRVTPAYSEQMLWLDVGRALGLVEQAHEYAALWLRYELENAAMERWSSMSGRLSVLAGGLEYGCKVSAREWGKEAVYVLVVGPGPVPELVCCEGSME